MKRAEPQEVMIQLPPLNLQTMQVTLIGDSPLICHAWSKKAKQEMLDKQMKKAKQQKTAKDPQKDYEESLYKHPAHVGHVGVFRGRRVKVGSGEFWLGTFRQAWLV